MHGLVALKRVRQKFPRGIFKRRRIGVVLGEGKGDEEHWMKKNTTCGGRALRFEYCDERTPYHNKGLVLDDVGGTLLWKRLRR